MKPINIDNPVSGKQILDALDPNDNLLFEKNGSIQQVAFRTGDIAKYFYSDENRGLILDKKYSVEIKMDRLIGCNYAVAH